MSTHSMFRLIGAAVALAALLGAGAWTEVGAQTSTGTIRGFVRDQQGAPVIGASVVATQVWDELPADGGHQRRGSGPRRVAAGAHLLRVSSIGFVEQERPVCRSARCSAGVGLAEQAIALEAIAVEAERPWRR